MLICGNIVIQNGSLDLQYKQRLAFQIVSSYIFWKFPDIFENYIKSLNLIILLDQLVLLSYNIAREVLSNKVKNKFEIFKI